MNLDRGLKRTGLVLGYAWAAFVGIGLLTSLHEWLVKGYGDGWVSIGWLAAAPIGFFLIQWIVRLLLWLISGFGDDDEKSE